VHKFGDVTFDHVGDGRDPDFRTMVIHPAGKSHWANYPLDMVIVLRPFKGPSVGWNHVGYISELNVSQREVIEDV
jgi:hypothetical protein